MIIKDWFSLGLTGLISLQLRDTQESSPTPRFKSINSSVLSLLCWSSREEIPQVQGDRNPNNTVATERGHQRADRLKLQSQTTSQSDHRTTALCNAMKLSHAMWGHPRWMGHGRQVGQKVAHWRRECKSLQNSCLENPMNSVKRQKDRTQKDELPRSIGAQYATGDQCRNNSRNNEGVEPKQNQHPLVDVTVDRSKVQCCTQQYCIGNWNVRSMNQGKLEVVK